MEKIFENANEQHLRAAKLYLKAEDQYVYLDEKNTKVVNRETLLRLFELGVILLIDTKNKATYVPVFAKDSGTEVTLTYMHQGSAVEFKTVKSKEA